MSKINKSYLTIVICAIAITTTLLNWGNRRTIAAIDDSYLIYELKHKSVNTTDLTSPIWTGKGNIRYSTLPVNTIDPLTGSVEIKSLYRNSIDHTYIIRVTKPSMLKENTFYFPGWTLYVNNLPHKIIYQSKNYPGIILFELKKGIYYVELKFEQTTVRIVGKIISIITFIILIFISLINRNTNKVNRGLRSK